MKNVIIVVIVLLALGLVPGCSLNATFVRQVDRHTALILPEYQTYVANDERLDTTTRRIRIESAQALRALIVTAREQVAPDDPE